MRTYKLECVEASVTDEIICNFCGAKILRDKHGYFFDHIHLEKVWQYNSKQDGQKIELDICENCFDELKNKMAVPCNIEE